MQIFRKSVRSGLDISHDDEPHVPICSRVQAGTIRGHVKKSTWALSAKKMTSRDAPRFESCFISVSAVSKLKSSKEGTGTANEIGFSYQV